MYCKDCKYWEDESNGFGDCKCPKFKDISQEQGIPKDVSTDSLVYFDYEDYRAYFHTGKDFGCVHFTKREMTICEKYGIPAGVRVVVD